MEAIRRKLDIEVVLCGPDEAVDSWTRDGVTFVEFDARDAGKEEPSSARQPHRDHPQYLLSTSGTTGEPRLVLSTSEGIARYLDQLQSVYPLGPEDTVLGLTSLAFDGAFREVLATLTTGATLIWDDAESIRNPMRVMELLHQFDVTVLPNLVPSRLRSLAELARLRGCRADSVRLALCCGESLSFDDYLEGKSIFGPQFRMLNQYGVSEYSMAATWRPVRDLDDAAEDGSVLIGEPVGDTRVVLVDGNDVEVTDGAVGEICLSGPGLAQGYVGEDQEKVDRFVTLTDKHGTPVACCRTGDLARRMSDGGLKLLGRLDDQVTVHGLRVHPLEVEAVIRGYAGVADCAVTATTYASGDTQLHAHIVPAEAGPDHGRVESIPHRPPAPRCRAFRFPLREHAPDAGQWKSGSRLADRALHPRSAPHWASTTRSR